MNEHTVKSYEDEFKLLDRRIAQMGGYAEKLLVQAMNALERRDPKLAENAVASDEMIDQLERELQEQVIVMIAKRQPLANDLRHIMTVLKIAGDLERIGDLAKNIAKRALAVAGETYPKPLMTGMRHMTEMVQHPAQGRPRCLSLARRRKGDESLARAISRSTRCTIHCSANF